MKRFSQSLGRHPFHRCQVHTVAVPPTQANAARGPAQRDHFVVQSGAVGEVNPADIAVWIVLEDCVPVIVGTAQEQVLVNRAHQDCAVGAALVAPPVDKAFGNAPANSGPEPLARTQGFFGCARFQVGIFF